MKFWKSGNNSENHHGVLDVLLELTQREIWLKKKFRSSVFWAFKMLSSKCHKNYTCKNFENNYDKIKVD